MAFFLRDNDDEVLEGSRYYWKITKLLQDIQSCNLNGKVSTFKLHNRVLQNIFFFLEDEFVYIKICNLNGLHAAEMAMRVNDAYHWFDLRAGIVGDDLKEIVAVKARFYDKLITRSELDSILLSNKVVYLFIEIKDKENVQKMKARKEQIERDYRDLLLSGKNSDVTLKVKNKKFYCHRCILAARSPVFAAMMQKDLKNKGSGDMIIEDADPDVFKKFLLFLYTGKEDYLSWQNLTDLYQLADKYGVEDIKSVCRNDIEENVNSGNLCDFFKFSLLHNDSELYNICRDATEEKISSYYFCELFKLSVLLNDSELTKTIVQYFLKKSDDIVQHRNFTTFLAEDSKKWLSMDYIKEIITTENFFFFFKLSQIRKDLELTETTVHFFLKRSKEIVQSENWLTLLFRNPIECNVLITALVNK